MDKIEEARAALKKAESLLLAKEVPEIYVDYLLVKGKVETSEGNFSKALDSFTLALKSAKKLRLIYHEMMLYYGLGRCHLGMNEIDLALACLKKGLVIARDNSYDAFLIMEARDNLKIFEFGLENNLMVDYLRDILSKINSDEAQLLLSKTITVKGVYDLGVRFFQNIEFYDSQGKILPFRWRTRKARTLFIYLLMNRYKKVTRDQLIDIFWPNVGLNEALRLLHVNLTYLRRTLKRLLKLPLPNKTLILYSDFTYQLNPQIRVKCDALEFETLVKEGVTLETTNKTKCIELYGKALALYRGDFCIELYDVWCDNIRSYFREQSLKIAKKLGRFYSDAGDYKKAINFYKQATEITQIDEESYIGVMHCLNCLGDKKGVDEQYKKLKEILKKEINTGPSLRVVKVYQEITSKKI